MYRSGLHVGHLTPEQARQNAGLRQMPLFAADANISNKVEDDCTKHKYCTGALGPGLMVCCICTTHLALCCNVAMCLAYKTGLKSKDESCRLFGA